MHAPTERHSTTRVGGRMPHLCGRPGARVFPSPGKIEILRVPGGNGIRDDSGVYEGWDVPIYYDPMISKLCAYGRTRTKRFSACCARFRNTPSKALSPTFRSIVGR